MTPHTEPARAALSDAHARMLPTEIAAHALDLATALADADHALVKAVEHSTSLYAYANMLRGLLEALAKTLENVVAAAIAGDNNTAGTQLGLAVSVTSDARGIPPLAEAPTYAPLAETWPNAFSPAAEVGTIH